MIRYYGLDVNIPPTENRERNTLNAHSSAGQLEKDWLGVRILKPSGIPQKTGGRAE